MELKIINKENNWNNFLLENEGSFLQSFEWGEFQKQFSRKVWWLEINKDYKKILQAQVIKEKVPLFVYFYIPYGPIFNKEVSLEEKKEAFILFLKEIKNIAEKERVAFLRLEPTVLLPKVEIFNFKTALKRIQPQKTMILNLEKSEEEILKNMHIRTRYNIKLAKRKGVEIKILDDYSDMFYRLLGKTRERQGFSSFSEEHYKKIFKINSKDFKVKMFLAEYQGKVIVASIIVFFGNRVISLHAGSDYEYRAVKGADLLHWNAILYGKKMGYKIYDFWGIDEKKIPGVTSFKRGFRGEEIEYPLGIDIVFDNIGYQIYRIVRKIKQIF